MESKRLAYNLTKNPDDFEEAIERYTGSVVVAVSYGRRVDGPRNPIITEVNDKMNELERTNQPGRYLVETYPWLNKLPMFLAPWKAKFTFYREDLHRFFWGLAMEVGKRVDQGRAPDSWTRFLLENRSKLNLNDYELSNLSGSIFGAGVGTTAGTLLSAILAMTCFPEASKKGERGNRSCRRQGSVADVGRRTQSALCSRFCEGNPTLAARRRPRRTSACIHARRCLRVSGQGLQDSERLGHPGESLVCASRSRVLSRPGCISSREVSRRVRVV